MALPIGEILDLMRIQQIKTEGAKLRPAQYEDLEIIPDIP